MSVPKRVLVVDDEPDIRELLELTLARMGLQTATACDYGEALQQLERGDFDLCLTDMRLPDGDGLDLVRHIQQSQPDLPVAVITAHGNVETAVEALKAGAFDFVTKPVELRDLRALVTTALRLTHQPPAADSGLQLLGRSPAMATLRSTIAKLARSQAPVYISGESGTGKELVARLIHRQGPRAAQPFVPVNCGAIPSELMESELFGHRKGSFTGAGEKEGLFQAADGGTLFLDEVADLPLSMQVKLLRAIQEKAVRPIGAAQEQRVDVRVLSATHRDLERLVAEGRFREDLYYRINVIQLHVPPLRERREDIPELADFILQRLSQQMGEKRRYLTEEAEAALAAHPFSGNVRELENILERAVTLCDAERIPLAELHLPGNSPVTAQSDLPDLDEPPDDLEAYLQAIERDAIEKALASADYNKTAAARSLGISFRALRYRLKKLGME